MLRTKNIEAEGLMVSEKIFKSVSHYKTMEVNGFGVCSLQSIDNTISCLHLAVIQRTMPGHHRPASETPF